MLIFFSFLPVVVILLYTWLRDMEHPEPWSMLVKCFAGGALTTGLWFISGFPTPDFIQSAEILKDIFESFFYAAIPEEFVKLAVLYLVVWKSREFDQRLDGIVYAVFVSLGFATVENFMYVIHGGIATAVFRMYLSVPGHALFALVMGYYFSLARFSKQKKYLFYAYLFPVLFHGIFNTVLSVEKYVVFSPWMVIMIMVILIAVQIRIWKFFNKRIALQMEADDKEEVRKIIEKYIKNKK
jgi:protease PrsW